MGTVGEDRDVVSFNIIDPPAAPLDPVAPKRGLLLIGVLIAGLAGGGALAFVIHQVKPVFHDARALDMIVGRPVLGVVSMTWLDRHKARRAFRFSSFVVAGTALFLLFGASFVLQEQFTDLMRAILWESQG